MLKNPNGENGKQTDVATYHGSGKMRGGGQRTVKLLESQYFIDTGAKNSLYSHDRSKQGEGTIPFIDRPS